MSKQMPIGTKLFCHFWTTMKTVKNKVKLFTLSFKVIINDLKKSIFKNANRKQLLFKKLFITQPTN